MFCMGLMRAGRMTFCLRFYNTQKSFFFRLLLPFTLLHTILRCVLRVDVPHYFVLTHAILWVSNCVKEWVIAGGEWHFKTGKS